MTIELPKPALLPEGVAPDAYEVAIDAFREAIGSEHVHLDGELMVELRDAYAWPADDRHWPSAVLQPGSVEEVQAIVRLAAEHGVPLWVNGQGKNLGYGGAAPRLRGSVTINFQRMTRILEVNEELGYVVLEPGTTYYELVDELKARGGAWWPSTPDIGWGSVIGNTSDYGVGYTEFGDHFASIVGLEVVLPSGELLRTGMWASSTATAAHAHPRGFGPDVTGLFGQSNLGIITKMAKKLSPRPERYVALRFRVQRDEDIAPLVDATRELLLEGTLRNIPVICGILGTAAMRAPRHEWFEGRITDEQYRATMQKLGMGWWNLRAALYGPTGVVEAQLERCREVLTAAVPDGEFSFLEAAGDEVDAEHFPLHPDRVQAGLPSQGLLESIKWRNPDGGHLEFSPVAPATGAEALKLGGLVRDVMEEYGLDFWPSICVFGRSMVYLCVGNFDHSDEAAIENMYDYYEAAIRRLGAEGYPIYRGHLRGMDAAQDQFDWNDHAYRRFVERLKDALDPAGVLSPGKQGIWPARYRSGR